jgi:hypothetical protein
MDQREVILPSAAQAREKSQSSVNQAILTLQAKAAASIQAAAEKGEFSIWFTIPGFGKIRSGLVSQFEAAGYTVEESATSSGSFKISWDQDSTNLH